MNRTRNRKLRRAGLFAEAGAAGYRPNPEQEALLQALQRVHNQIVPTETEGQALAHETYRQRAEARRRQITGARSGPLDYLLTRPLDVQLPDWLDAKTEAAAEQAVNAAFNKLGQQETA